MPHNDFLWVGSQGGLPALLSLLVIMVAAVWQAWKRPDMAGRYALAATLIALIASSVNSAMRDAQIGLALLFIAMVYLRLAQETQDPDPWRDLLPSRRGKNIALQAAT
jgi:O-antigen ligase